jgi:hypothetical protein
MSTPPDASRLAETSRVLADWFEADAPRQEPLPLLGATLARTARMKPRPSWRASERWLPMAVAVRPAVLPRPVLYVALLTGLLVGILAAGLYFGRIVSSVALPSPRPSGPQTIVVAQDGSGDVRSITEAVAMATDGDVILVRPGTYREAVVVDKDISIRGDGAREEIVVEAPLDSVLPGGTDPVAYAFLLQTFDGRLANVTVVGQQVGAAIIVNGGTPTLEGLGIDLLGDWNLTSKPKMWGDDLDGPGTPDAPGAPGGHFGLTEGRVAIDFDQGSGGVLRDSTIEGFLWFGPDTTPTVQDGRMLDTCVGIWEPGAHPVLLRNEIHGCPYGWGVDVAVGAAATIDGNDIAAIDTGISIQTGALDVTVTGNSIHDSGVGVSAPYAKQLVVDDNVVSANNNALALVGATGSVTANRIRDNRGIGLLLGSGGDLEIVDNVIESNGTGILIDGYTYPRLRGNTICRNQTNLTQVGASELTLNRNDVCPDGALSSSSAP